MFVPADERDLHARAWRLARQGEQLDVVLGARHGYPGRELHAQSVRLTVLGTGILWFRWAGFNAGSALAANGVAAQAIMNTFLAPSAAMLGWLIVERLRSGRATTIGAASGAVAGLVAITPCAGFVGGMAPVYIGLIAGVVCFCALGLTRALRLDDSLDVIALHLIGGLVVRSCSVSSPMPPSIPPSCTKDSSSTAAARSSATRSSRRS
jgi:Amt family ammonium transporter